MHHNLHIAATAEFLCNELKQSQCQIHFQLFDETWVLTQSLCTAVSLCRPVLANVKPSLLLHPSFAVECKYNCKIWNAATQSTMQFLRIPRAVQCSGTYQPSAKVSVSISLHHHLNSHTSHISANKKTSLVWGGLNPEIKPIGHWNTAWFPGCRYFLSWFLLLYFFRVCNSEKGILFRTTQNHGRLACNYSINIFFLRLH